jgi:hypothetical protein
MITITIGKLSDEVTVRGTETWMVDGEDDEMLEAINQVARDLASRMGWIVDRAKPGSTTTVSVSHKQTNHPAALRVASARREHRGRIYRKEVREMLRRGPMPGTH